MHKPQRSHRVKDESDFGDLVMAFRSRLPSIPCKSKPLPAIAYGFHGPPELENNRKRQDFLIKAKYQNKLPDIPCDPKHIVLPANPNEFELIGRELNVIYTQFTNAYCGGKLDLIGNCFNVKPSSTKSIPEELDAADRFLLEDDDVKDKHEQLKRSIAHKRKVTWLRRPEYMTPETSKFNRPIGEKLEFRVHNAINKKFKCDTAWDSMGNLCDIKSRVKGIEETFEDACTTLFKHPSKPNVYAEEVIPLFPDEGLSDHMLVEIVFDTSPSECANVGKISEDQMKEALLHALSSPEEEGVERIGYFVPKHDGINDRDSKPCCDSNQSGKEYLLARDYVFKVGPNKNLTSNFDTYVFIEKDDMLTYRAISKKMNLNRSIKSEAQISARNTKLLVKHSKTARKPVDQFKSEPDLCVGVEKSLSVEIQPESDSSIGAKDDNDNTVATEEVKCGSKLNSQVNSPLHTSQEVLLQPRSNSLIQIKVEKDEIVTEEEKLGKLESVSFIQIKAEQDDTVVYLEEGENPE